MKNEDRQETRSQRRRMSLILLMAGAALFAVWLAYLVFLFVFGVDQPERLPNPADTVTDVPVEERGGVSGGDTDVPPPGGGESE